MRKLLFAVGFVNFFAAAVVSLARNEKPSKDFWARHAYVLFGFTLAGLVAPPVQGWVADSSERRRRKKLEFEKSIREILTGTLVNIVETTGADWKRTGVSVFLVEKRLGWRWPPVTFRRSRWFVRWEWHWPPRVEFQRSVTRIKNSFSPPPSGIDWTKGKGIVGRCWAERDNVVRDLRDAFGPHMALTREQWDQLDNATRFGLSFDEFQRTKGWYGVVGAAPILDREGKYRGCVSFDTPLDCSVSADALAAAATMSDAAQYARAAAVWIEQAQALTSNTG